MKLDIYEKCESARYSHLLDEVVNELGGKDVLRLDYYSDYQGHVDLDVLLNDGRVFSYQYSYGSCSGCDGWEYRGLSDKEIKTEMLRDATFFDDMEQYYAWRKQCEGGWSF
jgi:hypothetical protein